MYSLNNPFFVELTMTVEKNKIDFPQKYLKFTLTFK